MSLVTGLFFLVLLLKQRWSPPLGFIIIIIIIIIAQFQAVAPAVYSMKSPEAATHELLYSDTSANEDNSFRNHIR